MARRPRRRGAHDGRTVRSTRLTSMDASAPARRRRAAARRGRGAGDGGRSAARGASAGSALGTAARSSRGRAAASRARGARAVNITDVSIKNPVFAWMLMACTMLFGIVAITRIGISQYPDVDYPNISVSVSWPGAVAVGRRARDRRAARAGDLAGRGRASRCRRQARAGNGAHHRRLRHVAQRRPRAPGRAGTRRAGAALAPEGRPAGHGVEVEPRRPRHPHRSASRGPFSRQVLADVARYQVQEKLQTVAGVGQITAHRLPRTATSASGSTRAASPRRASSRTTSSTRSAPSTSRCPAGSSRRAVARSTCASSARPSTSRSCASSSSSAASPRPIYLEDVADRGGRLRGRDVARAPRRRSAPGARRPQAARHQRRRRREGGPRARRRDPALAPRGNEGRGPLRLRRSSSRSRSTRSSSSSAWPSS